MTPNTMAKRSSADTRTLILEAAGQILRTKGAKRMTLEAVAQAAGVSKGGLLYHFASKEILIEQLFHHHEDAFDGELMELFAQDSADSGGWLRAYAQASINQIVDKDTARLLASLYAAADEFPSVHDVMRMRYDRWQARIEASRVDPVLATLVRLAVDGLWFSEMYQYAPPDAERREQILQLIATLTRT